MTEKDPIAEHTRWLHRAQPIEMVSIELRIGGALPHTHLLDWQVNQPAIMIAEHMDGVQRHQHIHGPRRIERPACHVAEIDDVGNALRADVGEHGFQRKKISVHVGNGGKAHRRSYPGGVPLSASTWPAR